MGQGTVWPPPNSQQEDEALYLTAHKELDTTNNHMCLEVTLPKLSLITFRRTPISRSPLEKNPMPGHLSQLHPVDEVNTKGQFFCASFGKNLRFQIQLDKWPLITNGV